MTQDTLPFTPPVAEKRPKIDMLHGDERIDDYYWLREKASPDVIAYLEAENAYAEAFLSSTKGLQETLYNEMVGRIKQTDLTVPYRKGEYLYYKRTQEGKQYSVFCRKHRSIDAPEEVLLDLNVLGEGHEYIALGAYEVSDDGRFLAYSLDTSGFREYTLYVKDLSTGSLLVEGIEKVDTVGWSTNNRTLFYVVENEAKRTYRLYRRSILESESELVFEENDDLFYVAIERSRSREYLFRSSYSFTTTEYHYLAADDPTGEWRIIEPRQHEREYHPKHHGDRFYIRVNDTGRNFRLVVAPVSDPGRENWEEIIPHREGVMIEAIDLFIDHYVHYQLENGLRRMIITDMGDGSHRKLEFPEPAYEAYPSHNAEWNTTTFRFSYESFVTPRSIYDYDMASGERTLLKQTEVLGGYDPQQYVSDRLNVTAADGTSIPISIVYRREVPRDGSAPMLLYGYGGYGLANPVGFSSSALSLLDRGFVLAIAHIRGGGELGKTWHDAGRMMEKMNSFTDFITAAESLIEGGYTSKERLVIEGGSAGGLLMGAVVNIRPDLFRVVLSHVPFVDVINTLLDDSLPLTTIDHEEWGNPAIESEYRYMKQYCPYTNIVATEYPAMLVKTSLNDSQVMYWEPAKYVAKLRAMKTDSKPLLLVTNMGAGHGGASGRYDALRERALDFAFILSHIPHLSLKPDDT